MATIMFLSGVTNDRIEPRLIDAGVGVLVQPDSGYVRRATAYPAFAADNGCFSKGATFDAAAWLRWLATVPVEGCLFAVAPDVVGDHDATVARSAPWLAEIRALGLPAAFVGQDGATVATVPWDSFDVLFIGGSTEWKLGPEAAALVAEAKRRGMWVHMGRVNSYKRLAYAAAIGCDSADGTYLAFGPDANLPKLEGWLRRLDAPDLFAAA
jgi:hypothetical protein